MPKFRKKPITIEATQWFPDRDVEGVVQPDPNSSTQFYPYVTTLEGNLNVSPGDWVATGISGEKYPIKPDIFAQLYMPEDDEAIAAWNQAYGDSIGD